LILSGGRQRMLFGINRYHRTHGASGSWEPADGPLTASIPFTNLKYDFGKTPVIGQPLEKALTSIYGLLSRTTAEMEKGLTLGAIDPERGTVGVPVKPVNVTNQAGGRTFGGFVRGFGSG
jgi:hypothetical protein